MRKQALIISILLNLLLIVLLMRSNPAESLPIPRMPRLQPGSQAEQDPASPAAQPSADWKESSAWNWLEAGTPAEMMAKLRAAGCPEQTVRDIVVMRVCQKYRSRLREHEAAAARSWDWAKHFGPAEARERGDWQRDQLEEMQTELEQLFGQSWGVLRAEMLGWPWRQPASSLSLAQQKTVRDIERRYAREAEQFSQRSLMGQLDEQDRTRLRQIETEKWAALAAALPPKEFEDYWYRASAAADYVRNNLPEPKNEEEFRKMVKVADEFQMMEEGAFVRVAGRPPVDEQDARVVKERQEAFEKRLREVLGEERAAQQETEEKVRQEEERRLKEARDMEQERSQLQEQAASVGVSAEDASRFFDRLVELKPTLEKKFNELQKSLTGTREEKDEQLKATIRAEMETIATQTIGEKGPAVVQKLLEGQH